MLPKGHFILHITSSILNFAPKSFFSMLIPNVSFSFILDHFLCLFLKACCPKCHLSNILPNMRNFAMKLKAFPCFMKSGISLSQLLYSRDSDIEKNDSSDKLKWGNVNKNNLRFFVFSTDIIFD